MDEVRYCALPGCNVVIEPVPGRPERRYCTAAHRGAARQVRRAAARREQAALVTPPPERPARSSASTRKSIRNRQRALAILGVAGLFAGGYAVTASEPVPAPPPPQAVPVVPNEDEWAAQARIALTSLERQLDTLAQTEQEWERVVASRQTARSSPPAPVHQMRERKSLLERQRATLQSQLETYRTLQQTRTELDRSEQHLRSVERALQNLPPGPRRTPEHASTIAALTEQRDLRIRQRDVKREELQSLRHGIDAAKRKPLPNNEERTIELSKRVREAIRYPDRHDERRRTDATPRRPKVVGGRSHDEGRPRQDVATSGPPDPRGPRDTRGGGSDARAAAPRGGSDRGRGPVGEVAEALGQVLGGAPRHGDERGRATRSRATGKRKAAVRGPGGSVGERGVGSRSSRPRADAGGDGGAVDRDRERRSRSGKQGGGPAEAVGELTGAIDSVLGATSGHGTAREQGEPAGERAVRKQDASPTAGERDGDRRVQKRATDRGAESRRGGQKGAGKRSDTNRTRHGAADRKARTGGSDGGKPGRTDGHRASSQPGSDGDHASGGRNRPTTTAGSPSAKDASRRWSGSRPKLSARQVEAVRRGLSRLVSAARQAEHTKRTDTGRKNSRPDTGQKRSGQGTGQKKLGQGTDQKKPRQGTDQKKPRQGTDQKKPRQGTDQKKPGQGTDQKKPGQGTGQKKPGQDSGRKNSGQKDTARTNNGTKVTKNDKGVTLTKGSGSITFERGRMTLTRSDAAGRTSLTVFSDGKYTATHTSKDGTTRPLTAKR